MKKILNSLKLFLVGAIILPTIIQSCSKNDYPSKYALVTLKHPSSITNDYIGLMDDGKKIYFSDKSRLGGYIPKDGQRAIIYYTPLDEKIAGYDYNAAIYNVEEVLTQDVVVLSDPSKDTLGIEGIGINNGIIGGGYLTLQIAFKHNDGNKHYFNLVDNQLKKGKNAEDGYITLDLRHKKKYDYENGNTYIGLVSYYLGLDYNPTFLNKEGIRVRYKNLRDQDVELKIKNDGKYAVIEEQ